MHCLGSSRCWGPGGFAGCVERTAAGMEQGIWAVAVVSADMLYCYFVCYELVIVVLCGGTVLAAAGGVGGRRVCWMCRAHCSWSGAGHSACGCGEC
jgi:hypothetical protein